MVDDSHCGLPLVGRRSAAHLVRRLYPGPSARGVEHLECAGPSLRVSAERQALDDGLLEFLVLPVDKRDEILQNLPAAIQGATIASGTFANQDRDVPTFSLATHLVARGDVPEETVYRILKVLVERHEEFVVYQNAAREWTLERTLSEAALPYHGGAIRYFRERDLWDPELQSRQDLLVPE